MVSWSTNAALAQQKKRKKKKKEKVNHFLEGKHNSENDYT